MLISAVALKIESICRPMMETVEEARDLSCGFVNYLPKLHNMLRLDDEVILAYPGFVAIAAHRIAHWLLERKLNLIPRLISEIAHARTGIDIHPGAHIGQSFVIDHGTGIVIGETTVIKDNVTLYQGVTVGALSVKRDFINLKRHPTIESNVIIYANATILGGDTTIGENCIIGGNMWITRSIAPGTRIYRESDDSQLI